MITISLLAASCRPLSGLRSQKHFLPSGPFHKPPHHMAAYSLLLSQQESFLFSFSLSSIWWSLIYLCHILFLSSKLKFPCTLKGRGDHKGMDTRRRDISGGSFCHTKQRPQCHTAREKCGALASIPQHLRHLCSLPSVLEPTCMHLLIPTYVLRPPGTQHAHQQAFPRIQSLLVPLQKSRWSYSGVSSLKSDPPHPHRPHAEPWPLSQYE